MIELTTIPESEKNKEDFKALVDTIRMYNIKDKESLITHIEQELNTINTWLRQNNSTGIQTVQLMTTKVAKLARLKYWKTICEQHI